MRCLLSVFVLLPVVFGAPALAETETFGSVDLTGLARDSWPLNRPGESNAMVCNVKGPDGFLTIRQSPSTSSASARKLKRLAILVVDTRIRSGNWVRVLSAHRTHTVRGAPQSFKDLPVRGWAHDRYLCDFLE